MITTTVTGLESVIVYIMRDGAENLILKRNEREPHWMQNIKERLEQ